MERVMVFMDGANLMMACRSFDENMRINHKKLVKILAGDRDLRRSYYYDSYRKNTMEDKDRRFFDTLQFLGITVRLRPLKEMEDGSYHQRGISMALAIDALSMAYQNAFDTAIIVSGDDEFTPLVEHLKGMGKRVEVAFFIGSTSKGLKLKCDDFITLDDFAYDFELEREKDKVNVNV